MIDKFSRYMVRPVGFESTGICVTSYYFYLFFFRSITTIFLSILNSSSFFIVQKFRLTIVGTYINLSMLSRRESYA